MKKEFTTIRGLTCLKQHILKALLFPYKSEKIFQMFAENDKFDKDVKNLGVSLNNYQNTSPVSFFVASMIFVVLKMSM